MKDKSQKQRVLDALEKAGGKGVTENAFLGPDTADGGVPIQKFTARVNELRNSGHDIRTRRTRAGTVYYLANGGKRSGNGDTTTTYTPAEMNRRIREYRKLEKEAGLSARAIAIEHRRKIIELAQRLRRVEPVVFWKSVSDDDLEMVFEEVYDLHEWVERVLASLDAQRGDKRLREKIAHLRDTRGRTLPEAQNARRKADELEARLLT